MTRIEKIRQMTDEELAEFLSTAASCALLKICTEQVCPDPAPLNEGVDSCAVCMLRWLREEGPLMDGEGV